MQRISASWLGMWKNTSEIRSEPGMFARRVDHPVRGRDPVIVGPAHHHVAEIADEAAGRGVHVGPAPVAAADLQAARHVVAPQDGERAVIGVLAAPQLAGQRRLLLRRVVGEPQHARVAVDLVVEENPPRCRARRRRST